VIPVASVTARNAGLNPGGPSKFTLVLANPMATWGIADEHQTLLKQAWRKLSVLDYAG
jgi:hypothetical protein